MARWWCEVNVWPCGVSRWRVWAQAGTLLGNFLTIQASIGTIRHICCHTCAKTQHKPLSRKKMRAQIAPIGNPRRSSLTWRAAMAAGGQ
jgi:hypothetical protein